MNKDHVTVQEIYPRSELILLNRFLNILYFCKILAAVKIYKQALAAILLMAFLAQTFNQGFYYLDYLINKTAFEKNCINKARKWMHCDGRCQLAKKIIESEKRQQEAPEMKLAGKTEVLSSRTFYTILIYSPVTSASCGYIPHNTGHPVDQPSSFFHPPATPIVS